MTINIIQTVTNILNEDRSIKSSSTVEAYLLIPDEGRALKNIKTEHISEIVVITGVAINAGSIFNFLASIGSEQPKNFARVTVPSNDNAITIAKFKSLY